MFWCFWLIMWTSAKLSMWCRSYRFLCSDDQLQIPNTIGISSNSVISLIFNCLKTSTCARINRPLITKKYPTIICFWTISKKKIKKFTTLPLMWRKWCTSSSIEIEQMLMLLQGTATVWVLLFYISKRCAFLTFIPLFYHPV